MDIINKTGVPHKNKGDGLSSSDVNRINSTVNLGIEANNLFLKSTFDINLEYGTTRTYTLGEVIAQVPTSRRRIGMKIRFLNAPKEYEEFTYVGEDLEVETWNDTHNWSHDCNFIDGGEW